MYQRVSNRGRKLPVLPDKWSKKTYRIEARGDMERQRDRQVNTTKFAKKSAIKKTAEKGDMTMETSGV